MTLIPSLLPIHPSQGLIATASRRMRLGSTTRHVVAMGVILLSVGAQAATPQTPKSQYQADRAACMKPDATQDRDACLKEAGAALQQSQKKGAVKSSGPNSEKDLAKNRTERCDALPQSDRKDCMRRMQGEGMVEGSVGAGGVLRSLETPVDPVPAK